MAKEWTPNGKSKVRPLDSWLELFPDSKGKEEDKPKPKRKKLTQAESLDRRRREIKEPKLSKVEQEAEKYEDQRELEEQEEKGID